MSFSSFKKLLTAAQLFKSAGYCNGNSTICASCSDLNCFKAAAITLKQFILLAHGRTEIPSTGLLISIPAFCSIFCPMVLSATGKASTESAVTIIFLPLRPIFKSSVCESASLTVIKSALLQTILVSFLASVLRIGPMPCEYSITFLPAILPIKIMNR